MEERYAVNGQVQDEINSYIIFRIKENVFTLKGVDVLSIQQMPQKLIEVPNAPDYVRGSYKVLGEIFNVVDLRSLFSWQTVEEEYQGFADMIEARKQDHVRWVDTLRESHATGSPFTLARDRHCCALGIWRDNYKTDAASINHLLDTMDIPHGKLHELADHVLKNDEQSEAVLQEISGELMPQVLKLLDDVKADFKNMEFKEMVLLLRGDAKIALTVDEVLGVENMSSQSIGGMPLMRKENTYVRGILQRPASDELIMELDVPALIAGIELSQTAQ